MHANRIFGSAILIATMSAAPATAQFSSGSDGSYGPITVPDFTSLTLDVPPKNGIFNATTVTVGFCGQLIFNRNALNTPVYLLATGDIVVGFNGCGFIGVAGGPGTTTAGGIAGPGGFDGGVPGIAGGAPAAGHGPGAGKGGAANASDTARAGNAAYGGPAQDASVGIPPSANDGVAYGSPLLVPVVGGSGGGGAPTVGGGGGGGAILLASDSQVIVNGFVGAAGGGGNGFGSGSGGAIRIVAPRVAGTGQLDVTGPCCAGHGRVRIDLIDRTGLTLQVSPPTSLSVGSFMAVFPSVVPRLDIMKVAGNPITEGTSGPVVFVLPFNSPTTQPIVVQARDFTGVVPIRVVLTPDSGEPTSYDADIDMSGGNPASVEVNATFPINVAVRIHAWTRTP